MKTVFWDLVQALRVRGAVAGFGRVAIAAAMLCATLVPVGYAQRADVRSLDGATTVEKPKLAVARRHMVSAANPYATEAGLEILRAGGSAVDAVIATQLVLGLVEPQSSGIGGGAFLLRLDGKSKQIASFDGRERAPMAARPDRFMRDGKPIPFMKAVNSGLSIGVPGIVGMLADVHARHGKLAWEKLFAPAIALSEKGFRVSPHMNRLMVSLGAGRFDARARAYLFDGDGVAWPVGHLLRNPEFAETLRGIAKNGPSGFYEGGVAQEIVEAVASAPNFKGDMTLQDLRDFRSVERAPVCVTYRKKRVCSMGPPSSGAHTVGQALMLLDGFDLGREAGGTGPGGASALHLIVEAEALAYADRDRYLADSEFVRIPRGLLDPSYVKSRRVLIDPSRSMGTAKPGTPLQVKGEARGIDDTFERAGTTHISVVDSDGNVVSMTSSIEGPFGAGVWAAGFLLNNELTDFSFRPKDADGRAVANRVEGGKRPRSSMSPTIIMDENNEFFAAVGSQGGSRIILYVLKTVVALVDWGMDAQSAVALSHFGNRNRGLEIETGFDSVWRGEKLEALGHQVKPGSMSSGLHVIVSRGDRYEGGADPRREGVALGD